jgi:hypothetical protein
MEFLDRLATETGYLQTIRDLLFPDDPEYTGRIASHPALLWKITNIRSRKNLRKKSNIISKG